MATRSVSQAIDEDECGSFIVVHRWSNDERNSPQDKEEGEGGEEFLDAAASLVANLSNVKEEDENNSLVQNREGTETPHASYMMEDARMREEEQFSMTNYSTVSSTASEQQLEEIQTRLNQVIGDHRSLKELLERQNLELEQRKMAIDELKLLANESVGRERLKSEESRTIIQKLTEERDATLKELESLRAAAATSASTSASVTAAGFEALETYERQLLQRDQIIQQQAEQMKELSTRLHQEAMKREELSELLRIKEEEEKVKNDSLSSSDEALAKSIAEKERLEDTLEESFKKKNELQEEISRLREQLGAALNDVQRLQNVGEKLDSSCAALDAENREMRIRLAAVSAEMDQKVDLLNQEISKNQAMEQEKVACQREVDRLNELVQARTTEVENLQKQIPGGGNRLNTSVSGLLSTVMKPLRSYGLRDEHDDPNEPFQDTFEHVGAQQNPHAQQESEQVVVFQCPICLKRFDEFRKLEFHASNCGVVEGAMNSDPFVFP